MKPVSSYEGAINGFNTQILVQSYADRVLVVVTQVGKIGCLIQAQLPQTIQLVYPAAGENPNAIQPLLPTPPPSIELTPILGHPPSEELHTFYNLLVCQIATLVWSAEEKHSGSYGTRRPVIVGIALKYSSNDEDQELEAQFRGVTSAIQELVDTPDS